MRILLLASLLFSSACVAGERDMSEPQLICSYKGKDESVCPIFRQALEAIDREDIATLEIERTSPSSARAIASGHDGREILTLDFDVMDTEISGANWREFARSFARQLMSE